MKQHAILVVEDRESLRRMMQIALEGEGYAVRTAADVAAAREALEHAHDLVITDLQLPDGTGIDVLRRSKERRPEVPVVVLTAFGSVGTAVEAMKLGAVDFLEKPLELEHLFRMARSLMPGDGGPEPPRGPEAVEVPSEGVADGAGGLIVGRHPKLLDALRLLRRVAPTETTVLLTGESGTGKELFARTLHAASKRAGGPFVAVNCAAIPESLIENELFGHERGAFTGAVQRQRGRFEMAQGGTLFLDEIGELRSEVQGKILRVLEERVFERVGSGQTQKADVRIVAATNRDLLDMTRRQEFRLDLFYRLNIFPIELPPLRERASDIPALAVHLLKKLGERLKASQPTITTSGLGFLEAQPWPGNVRELSNVLERGMILAERGSLDAADLAALLGAPSAAAPPVNDERERIKAALRATDGDKQRAAGLLDVAYRTLQRKIRDLDLEGYPKYRS
jgi:DNA-binding NtrC family response regulator